MEKIVTKKYDVFISYAWADKDEVLKIVDYIQRSIPGLNIWRDDRKGEIGKDHWKKIETAIKESRYILVMHSDKYLCSKSCYKEWKFAGEHKIERIPVLLKGYDLAKSFIAEETDKNNTLYCVYETRTSRKQLINMLSNNCDKPIGMVSYEVNGVTFNMLRVASHLEKVSSELCCKMGATETEKGYYGNELPKHIERFQEFFIAETPVTEALWHAVMGDNYSLKDEDKEKPKVNINYEDCKKFIDKLKKLTNVTFRIPYENEWEAAASGLKEDSLYAGRKRIKLVAWYNDNSDKKLHPVKQKEANAFGLYDMSGNVWEWCKNLYYMYPAGEVKHPTIVEQNNSQEEHVIRGGCYASSARDCRIHRRNKMHEKVRSPYVGLRLAMWFSVEV